MNQPNFRSRQGQIMNSKGRRSAELTRTTQARADAPSHQQSFGLAIGVLVGIQ